MYPGKRITCPVALNSAFFTFMIIDVCFNLADFIWLAIVRFQINSYNLELSSPSDCSTFLIETKFL